MVPGAATFSVGTPLACGQFVLRSAGRIIGHDPPRHPLADGQFDHAHGRELLTGRPDRQPG